MLGFFKHQSRNLSTLLIYFFFRKKYVFPTESVTEGVFSQNEFNSSDLLLRMGDVTCVFLFVIVLKLCKKSYSKRRENMYPVSQEENTFSEST